MSGPVTLSPEAESARQVCARLHQASRDLRLYPEDHPTVRATLDRLLEAVTSHLEKVGPLVLQVGGRQPDPRGRGGICQRADRDNLAFIMFRDGIRGLTFHEGIEPTELEALVDCLARTDQLADDDHDLITALWEQDLVHIEFEVVDPFLEGEGSSDDAFDELREPSSAV